MGIDFFSLPQVSLIYGFTPGHKNNNGEPYVYAFHYDYVNSHNICWPVWDEAVLHYGIHGEPHCIAFEADNCYLTREEANKARDTWYFNKLKEMCLDDDEWVEWEYRKYLGRYYSLEEVDKYMNKIISTYSDIWHTDIKVYDGKVWAKETKDVGSCIKPLEGHSHKETKAEKEARIKKQIEDNLAKFGTVYKEVII